MVKATLRLQLEVTGAVVIVSAATTEPHPFADANLKPLSATKENIWVWPETTFTLAEGLSAPPGPTVKLMEKVDAVLLEEPTDELVEKTVLDNDDDDDLDEATDELDTLETLEAKDETLEAELAEDVAGVVSFTPPPQPDNNAPPSRQPI